MRMYVLVDWIWMLDVDEKVEGWTAQDRTGTGTGQERRDEQRRKEKESRESCEKLAGMDIRQCSAFFSFALLLISAHDQCGTYLFSFFCPRSQEYKLTHQYIPFRIYFVSFYCNHLLSCLFLDDLD